MNMIAFILAATLSAGNAEFDSTARDGARDISLSRAREELRENGPASGALEKAMLADPKKFEKPDEAETLCRDIFADELRAQFAAKARAIAERLGIESAPAHPRQSLLLVEVPDQFLRKPCIP